MTEVEQKIAGIIRDVEEVEHSHESSYTKDCARLSAYYEIKEIIVDAFKKGEKE